MLLSLLIYAAAWVSPHICRVFTTVVDIAPMFHMLISCSAMRCLMLTLFRACLWCRCHYMRTTGAMLICHAFDVIAWYLSFAARAFICLFLFFDILWFFLRRRWVYARCFDSLPVYAHVADAIAAAIVLRFFVILFHVSYYFIICHVIILFADYLRLPLFSYAIISPDVLYATLAVFFFFVLRYYACHCLPCRRFFPYSSLAHDMLDVLRAAISAAWAMPACWLRFTRAMMRLFADIVMLIMPPLLICHYFSSLCSAWCAFSTLLSTLICRWYVFTAAVWYAIFYAIIYAVAHLMLMLDIMLICFTCLRLPAFSLCYAYASHFSLLFWCLLMFDARPLFALRYLRRAFDDVDATRLLRFMLLFHATRTPLYVSPPAAFAIAMPAACRLPLSPFAAMLFARYA